MAVTWCLSCMVVETACHPHCGFKQLGPVSWVPHLPAYAVDISSWGQLCLSSWRHRLSYPSQYRVRVPGWKLACSTLDRVRVFSAVCKITNPQTVSRNKQGSRFVVGAQ